MKIKAVIFILILLILITPLVSAQDYYADISISVDDKGLTSIEGDTNIDKLIVEKSPEYTSKKSSYWLLNITTNKNTNSYYEINLPEGASISYMNIPYLSRIENLNSGLRIVGFAEEKKLNIIVQYEIKNFQETSNVPSWFIGLTSLIIVLLISAIRYRFKKIKRKRKLNKSININTLSSRQRQIITLLKKSNGSTTQAALEKETKLPKSSLSRNIDSLVRRDIITKEQSGMSNVISLKKD